MTTVEIRDHSDEYLADLRSRLGTGVGAAAQILAEGYVDALTQTWSWQTPTGPEHSRPGEIPHRYFGHREGGFQLAGYLQVNNLGQTNFLANHIAADSAPGTTEAFVGFEANHTRRGARGWSPGTNYLITHDPLSGYGQRPWIDPVYQLRRDLMIREIVSAL